jgi:phage anti-repressor protein
MAALEKYFQSENIDYIKCSSRGRLSKYYSSSSPQQTYPMKVMRESALSRDHKTIKNIQDATDLFQKYSESHAVNRIHCDFEELPAPQQKIVLEIIQS